MDVRGRELTVMDTPGTMDPKNEMDCIEEISRAIAECENGYDAFVIVVRWEYNLIIKWRNGISICTVDKTIKLKYQTKFKRFLYSNVTSFVFFILIIGFFC